MDNRHEREALKHRLRQAISEDLAAGARVRITRLEFGPYSPSPLAYRVTGPVPDKLREIAAQVQQVMDVSPMMRTVNTDCAHAIAALHLPAGPVAGPFALNIFAPLNG